MTIRPLTRNIALASGAGLAVVPLALAATPSFAAADCGEGTEVTAGICEKAYTTAGDYTFTAPSSVAKMSAVLVGGGQGGVYIEGLAAYGGGGGGVVFVDSVDISGPIAVTVGAAGVFGVSLSGDTTVGANAAGGGGGVVGDPFVPQVLVQSGSPQEFLGWHEPPASLPGIGSGGGSGGSPTNCAGGPGLTASSKAAGSSLFPAVLGEPVYGAGGSCLGITPLSAAGAGGDVRVTVPLAAEAGSDGAVIFRWAAASLPDTGVSVQPWLIGASVAGVLGGALLASGALRARRQGRHSA